MVCKKCDENQKVDEEVLLEKTNGKLLTVYICNACGCLYAKLPEPEVVEAEVDLNYMSLKQLQAYAEEKSIPIDKSIKKKAELIAYIQGYPQ